MDTLKRLQYFPVSPTCPLPLVYAPDVAVRYWMDTPILEWVYEPLEAMLYALMRKGFKPCMGQYSGFRSPAVQEGLREKRVAQLRERGYTSAEIDKRVNSLIAKPLCSEHHIRAVDIFEGVDVSLITHEYLTQLQLNARRGMYEWLYNHAHYFGFVFSYLPASKQSPFARQGSGCESAEIWHLSYVGVPFAHYLVDELGYLQPQSTVTLLSVLKTHYDVLSTLPIDAALARMRARKALHSYRRQTCRRPFLNPVTV